MFLELFFLKFHIFLLFKPNFSEHMLLIFSRRTKSHLISPLKLEGRLPSGLVRRTFNII